MVKKILQLSNNKIFKSIGLIIIVLAFLVFFRFLSNQLDTEKIQEIVASFGIISPLVFIFFCVLTVIFSPLVVTPFWMAGITLFDPLNCFLLAQIASIIGQFSNFLIARYFGRPVVQKFVGAKAMKEIDSFAEVVGLKLLFFLRMVGGPMSDYISYGAGLTTIRFLPYTLITTIGAVPWTSITFYLTYRATRSNGIAGTAGYFMLLATLTIITSAGISYLLIRGKNHHNKQKRLTGEM